MKELKETHTRGILSVESDVQSLQDCDFGIQIAADGRVWVCINGVAFIRFKPRCEKAKICCYKCGNSGLVIEQVMDYLFHRCLVCGNQQEI